MDNNARRMVSSGMLRRVTLVRTDVSEELSASFIRVKRLGELGTTLKEALSSSEKSVLTKPRGLTSQKTQFYIVTAVKTSNLTIMQEYFVISYLK
jgi:hypothetical protein